MVQLLRSKMQQQQIDWRRAKVLELSSQGYGQIEIATDLQIDKSVICRDLVYLRQLANENLKTHVQDKLPEEYQNCMTGIIWEPDMSKKLLKAIKKRKAEELSYSSSSGTFAA